MWIADNSAGAVSVLSDATGVTVHTVSGFGVPTNLAFDGADVWVSDWGQGEVWKL